jgi:two-component system sensor histidine kinase RegB
MAAAQGGANVAPMRNFSEASRMAGRDTLSHPGALATLSRLRWLSIAAQVLAIVLVPRLLPLHLPWLPMAGGVALLLAFNLWVTSRARRGAGGSVLLHLGVDIAVLAWQLYWSGGPANPFVSLFIVPIALATALLPARAVLATALMAVLAYGLLWLDHQPLPHVHGEFDLHLLGMWLNFLLTAAVLAFFGTRIASELARQRAALAAERERSVRDEGLLAVATLAAGAAHAINTPLATLSVVLSDLRDGMAGMDAAALQEDVALMSAQVEACRAAVGQLISDARSESGPLAAGRLDDRLHAAVERWRLLRPGFDARLEFSDDAGDIALAADRSFDYLVLNLLDNAADASRSAGSDGVVLRVSREPAFLRMTFLDQGPGLAGTPSPLRSDKPGGLGLGFALATRVCEQFDGALQPVSGGVLARLSLARLAAAA